MFKFKNIDSFIPGKFERMGMLKGKRWYIDTKEKQVGLFKPKRYEFGDKKVFCANHYGEFMGYLLASFSNVPVCKARLAHLTEYYANIHKVRYHATPEEKNGCITYSSLERDEELEHGVVTIGIFQEKDSQRFKELSNNKFNSNDNIEVCLNAIEHRIRNFYRAQENCPQNFIEIKVKENKYRAIQMMVYDCLYGNNDRHDENWAMRKSKDNISLYPLYDNERVLGLYENQNVIENALKNNNVQEVSENILFSRMNVPGETKKHSSYKDVLEYLMENYKDETTKALQEAISYNTPDMIETYLRECEDLPSCYVDFGTQMYRSRYEFGRELLNKNKHINNELVLRQPSRVVLPHTCLKFEMPNYKKDNEEVR